MEVGARREGRKRFSTPHLRESADVNVELLLSGVLLPEVLLAPLAVVIVEMLLSDVPPLAPVVVGSFVLLAPLADVSGGLLLSGVMLPLVLLVPRAVVNVGLQGPCGKDPGGCQKICQPAPPPWTARSGRGGQGEVKAGSGEVGAVPGERGGTDGGPGPGEK